MTHGSSPGGVATWLARAASRPVLATVATICLAAWVLGSVPATMSGLSTRALGVGLVGAALGGIWVGSRTLRFPAPVILLMVALAATLLGRSAIAIGHRVGLVSGPLDWTFIVIAVGTVVSAVVVGRSRRAGPRPTDALVAVAAWSCLVVDLRILQGTAFRDLGIYLRAGGDYVAGRSAYPAVPLTVIPADTSQFPFVYPPPTLPFFGLLAALPRTVVVAAWAAASLAAAIMSLRWLGVAWRWSVFLLLWPPFAEGLWVGNVAVPSLVFLAAASRLPWALVLGPVFKIQFGIPALWILRERRWRDLVIGAAILLTLTLVTLPLVGFDAWAAWAQGLRAFQASEVAVPSMFGSPLSRYLPYAFFLLIAGASILAGIVARGPAGLARLGVASVVASPSMYRHSLLWLIPGLLGLDEVLLWVALGVVTSPVGLWLSVGLAFFGTLGVRRAGRSGTPQTVHPVAALGQAGQRRSATQNRARSGTSAQGPGAGPSGCQGSSLPGDSRRRAGSPHEATTITTAIQLPTDGVSDSGAMAAQNHPVRRVRRAGRATMNPWG